jgi:hypothetical protein
MKNMSKEPYYLGFLANVDSSIMKVKLDYGFKIEKMSTNEYRDFIENIEKIRKRSLQSVLQLHQGIISKDGNIYFIKGLPSKLGGYRNYIVHLLTKLKLFKEGYVTLPVQIGQAYISNDKLEKAFFIMYSLGISKKSIIYSLSNVEATRLNKFIKEITLPIKEEYIQLAIDNLEESMRITRKHLSFLLLMIGFESLFNLDKTQITHTISRHTAILNSNNKTEFNTKYKEIKDFYNRRSALVHALIKTKKKPEPITDSDLIELRNSLRVCIKKTYKLNLNKNDLFEYLNTKGF